MENREMVYDQLDDAMIAVLNKHMDVATPGEAMMAAMGACAAVLAEIRCKDCRKIAAENAMKVFPDIIMDAMKFAAEEYGDDPPIDHRH